MSYVPVIVTPPAPSPRTRELADKLARVMVDFEQHHPTMTRHEMTEAARIALQSTRSSTGAERLLVPLLGLGVAAAVGVGAYFGVGRSGGEASSLPMIAIVAAVIVVGALLFVLRRRP